MGTSRTRRTPWDPIRAGLIFFTSPQWYNYPGVCRKYGQ